MALVIKDRVKETTTTTGTGTFNLAGAVSGFEGFIQVGDGNTTYYVCTDNTDFEIGIGTFTDASPDTLSRDTILQSSNSDNKVNWSAGTRTIFCTYPADKAVFEDASNNINGTFVGNITGNVTGNVSGTAATVTGAAQSNITSIGTLASNLNLGGQDIVTTTSNQDIDLQTHGTGKVVVKGNTDDSGSNPGAIKLNCEANSHGQTIIAAPHSESASNTLTLPSSGGNARLVSATSTATLTNKSLTAPILTGSSSSAGSILFKEDTDNGTNAVTLIGPASTADVTVTLPAATDTLVGKATTDTLTNKTIDVDNNTVSNIEVDNFKASAIVLESEGIGSNDNDTSLPTSAAVKDYVDTQITAEDLDLTTDSGTIAIDLDSETLTIAGGTGLASSASSNTVTLAVDAAQTGITSLLATDIKIGEDDQTKIDFETADTINFYAGNEKQLILTDGALTPGSNAIVDLGTDALEFKDAYFDGTVEADAITLNGTSITTTATLSTGISNGNVLVATSGIADNDFLKVDGTSIEGRSSSEVLSDIGAQASLTFGISNTNAVKIDSSSVADDEYARFTANGLESRSASETRGDIGLGTAAVLDTGISNTNVPKFTSGVADNDFLRVDGTAIEGRSASEVLSDIGGQASLTFGISNTNAVKIDHASVADDDFLRVDGTSIEGRSASQVVSDLGVTTASAAADEATALAIALG